MCIGPAAKVPNFRKMRRFQVGRLQCAGALLGVLQGCRGAAGGESRAWKYLGNICRHET